MKGNRGLHTNIFAEITYYKEKMWRHFRFLASSLNILIILDLWNVSKRWARICHVAHNFFERLQTLDL
jgi:hypothetical protein